MEPKFRIFQLGDVPESPMPGNRGVQLRMVGPETGATALDVHLNRLDAGEPGGRYHHHSRSDNVYIVKRGNGRLVVEEKTYRIHEDDIVYIPAGLMHSLTNDSDEAFEIFEIYAPAGEDFDFVVHD